MIHKLPKHERNYTKIDNRAINDERLSFRAKGVFGFLLSKRSDWQVSIRHLAQVGKVSPNIIRSCLKELAQCGYARLIVAYGQTGTTLNGKTWEIYELPELNPFFHSESVQAENATVDFSRRPGKRDVGENRNSEKCSLIITEETEITEILNNSGQNEINRECEKQSTHPPENWMDKSFKKNASIPPSSAAPPFLRQYNTECLFSQSKYVTEANGFDLFSNELIARGGHYANADLEYYYRRVQNWSDSKNVLRSDWIAAAAGIIESDFAQNKLKTSKTNESTTIDGLDAGSVLRRASKFMAKNSSKG